MLFPLGLCPKNHSTMYVKLAQKLLFSVLPHKNTSKLSKAAFQIKFDVLMEFLERTQTTPINLQLIYFTSLSTSN
jgi:hypothetical protein